MGQGVHREVLDAMSVVKGSVHYSAFLRPLSD